MSVTLTYNVSEPFQFSFSCDIFTGIIPSPVFEFVTSAGPQFIDKLLDPPGVYTPSWKLPNESIPYTPQSTSSVVWLPYGISSSIKSKSNEYDPPAVRCTSSSIEMLPSPVSSGGLVIRNCICTWPYPPAWNKSRVTNWVTSPSYITVGWYNVPYSSLSNLKYILFSSEQSKKEIPANPESGL